MTMTTIGSIQRDNRFLLPAVPWQTYIALREQYGYLIGRLIDVWTEELKIDVQSCRTVTFKREDIQRGLEPDNCYYISHELTVRDKVELDLSVDPPPDLAIEIDLGSSVTDKMALYAAFNVPEVWLYDGNILQVYILDDDGKYLSSQSSGSFPQLPPAEIETVLRRMGTASDTELVRAFRDWVRKTILPHSKT